MLAFNSVGSYTLSGAGTITLPGSNLDALAYGAGEVWVADSVARRLFEVDAASGSVRRALSIDFRPSAVIVERISA